jgi:hypothetical protein
MILHDDFDINEIEFPYYNEIIELEPIIPVCYCNLCYGISGRCQCNKCIVDNCNKRGKCLDNL